MKRIPNQQETETAMLVDYALVALAQLGGIATRDQIIDHVGKVFSDQLTPADRAYVYKGPDGKSAYIPPGYTGGKWEAWAGKTRSALVTTPHGSRARGFWIDAGMSSHTDCSFHAHERDKLKNNSCIAWHDWQDGIVFTRGPSPQNPYDIHLCTCKRTPDTFFLLHTKVEMGAATRRGFHPHASKQGPFAAVGKKSFTNRLEAKTTKGLYTYLERIYPGQLLTLPGDPPIWISFSDRNKGQAIGTRSLSNICEAYLGTSKFHAPRHTLAVTMHKKGAKITDISKALGHSDIKLTSDYLEEHLSYENPLASELEEEWGI